MTTLVSTDAGFAGSYVTIRLPSSIILQAGGVYVITYAPQVGVPASCNHSIDCEVPGASHSQFSGFNSLLKRCPAAPTTNIPGIAYLGAILSSSSGVSGSWAAVTGTSAYGCVRIQVCQG